MKYIMYLLFLVFISNSTYSQVNDGIQKLVNDAINSENEKNSQLISKIINMNYNDAEFYLSKSGYLKSVSEFLYVEPKNSIECLSRIKLILLDSLIVNSIGNITMKINYAQYEQKYGKHLQTFTAIGENISVDFLKNDSIIFSTFLKTKLPDRIEVQVDSKASEYSLNPIYNLKFKEKYYPAVVDIFPIISKLLSQVVFSKDEINKLLLSNIPDLRLFAEKNYTKDAETYYNKAKINFNNGKFTDAINNYNIAIEINPYFYIAYCARGQAKYALDNKEGACLDFKKAAELGSFEGKHLLEIYCK